MPSAHGWKIGLLAVCLVWAGPASVIAQSPPLDPLEVVVDSDWIPVPAFVVPAIPVPQGSWKHNHGWSWRKLDIHHEGAADGMLSITISDGDHNSGAPLALRLSVSGEGRVSVLASASTYSCVGSGQCVDLAGRVFV